MSVQQFRDGMGWDWVEDVFPLVSLLFRDVCVAIPKFSNFTLLVEVLQVCVWVFRWQYI